MPKRSKKPVEIRFHTDSMNFPERSRKSFFFTKAIGREDGKFSKDDSINEIEEKNYE